jgi:hypothetical protein
VANAETKRVVLANMQASIRFMAMLRKQTFERQEMFGLDDTPGAHDKERASWIARCAPQVTPVELRAEWVKDGFKVVT